MILNLGLGLAAQVSQRLAEVGKKMFLFEEAMQFV